MLRRRWKAKLKFDPAKGLFEFADKQGFIRWLSSKFKKNDWVEIKIIKWRSKRSLDQNAYYWGVVIDILHKHLGYTKDEMHSALKYLFLKEEKNGLTIIKSTAKLNTKEFSKYVEKVKDWASQKMGVFIPDANSELFKY